MPETFTSMTYRRDVCKAQVKRGTQRRNWNKIVRKDMPDNVVTDRIKSNRVKLKTKMTKAH